MPVNPFTKLPALVRLVVYVVVTLAFLAVGAWQAADGNIVTAVFSFLGSLSGMLAGSNLTPTDPKS